jgi:isopenicillin-N epimerase
MRTPHGRHWGLDPAFDHLNHGSFGATPTVVLAAQRAWIDRSEADLTRFVALDMEPALDAGRQALATFVGADPDDLAFVSNATTGVNTVLRSLEPTLRAGDELLTTDHAYNAVKTAMEAVAERTGARIVIAAVPFPAEGPAAVTAAVLERVGPRTRLAVLDHITSATALIFPIVELVAELARRGVDTLVDGAHAPGQVDLDLSGLGAAYYTGNLHKWVCAPKGAAFLHVRRDRQTRVRPLSISHGANSPRTDRSRFRLEFDWTGTADVSAWLVVPDAIRFGAELLPGGWAALRERNHGLCLRARDLLCEALRTPPPAPDTMIGCMASVGLPSETDPAQVQGVALYGDPVHDALLADGMQVMITPWPQRPDGGPWRRLVRISVAAYNELPQYERLARAVHGLVAASQATS